MAYIQDISLLMRELLKVPKDYTPTAMEISKYIKSRYSSDKDMGKRPMGARGFSSGPRLVTTKRVDATPPQPAKPRETKQRAARRNLSSSSINRGVNRTPAKKTDGVVLKRSEAKTSTKFAQNRTYHQRITTDGKTLKKPHTAPSLVREPKLSQEQHRTFWSWQSAKNHVRRAVSEISSTPAAKTKLSALADHHRMDPNMEVALERQRKEMLKHMVDQGADRAEPVRNREIIQKLLEDNKLEVQRREIARLTELARSKVLEARRATLAKNARKRDMEYAR